MANFVNLQARFQVKHDTLANWLAVESTFKPMAGELIVYEIPSNDTSITNAPATLIKVGDGENYLKDLKYLAARSADVAGFLKTDSTGATWTQAKFENWIKSLVTIDGLDTSAFAKGADLQKVAEDLAAEIERAKGAEAQALTDAKAYTDEKNTAMDTRMQAVEGKAHEHANKAELDLIAAGDKAKWDAAEQNAKDYADGLNTAMDERVDALEAKFGDGEGTVEEQIAAAVAAEKQRAEGIEGGLESRLAAVEGDYLKAADKQALQDQIDANERAIELLTNGVDSETVDGVNDLIAYVNEHGTEVTTMKADIQANADAVAAEKQRAEGVEGGLETRLAAVEGMLGDEGDVAGDIAAALEAAKKYTDDEVKELADGAVATNTADIEALEGLVGDTAVSAQIDAKITELKNGQLTTMQGEIDAVEGRAEALEAKAHEHANKEVLDGVTAEKVAAWDAKVDDVTAGAGLKVTRTGNSITMDIDETVIFVFNGGTSTTVME